MDKDIHAAIKIVSDKNEKLAVKLVMELSTGYNEESAKNFIDLMIYNRQPYKNAIVNGFNKSYNGSTRFWCNVKCTGVHKINKYGQQLIEVIDPYSDYGTRWLKLSSFTGTIVYVNDDIVSWDKGKEKDITRNIKNEHFNRTFEHKLMIVKEYFDMNHEQWKVFTKSTPVHVQQEMIEMCEKEKSNN